MQIGSTDLLESFQGWSEKTDRLDHFFARVLTLHNFPAGFEDLHRLVKSVLLLSHGNAYVESGFSVNKNLLIENLHEETTVNLRYLSLFNSYFTRIRLNLKYCS